MQPAVKLSTRVWTLGVSGYKCFYSATCSLLQSITQTAKTTYDHITSSYDLLQVVLAAAQAKIPLVSTRSTCL